MKILTDWIEGKPARRGLYLVRDVDDPDAYVSLLRWNGRQWHYLSGVAVHGRPPPFFRGLAFDPSAAEPEIDGEDGGRGWFVKEPAC